MFGSKYDSVDVEYVFIRDPSGKRPFRIAAIDFGNSFTFVNVYRGLTKGHVGNINQNDFVPKIARYIYDTINMDEYSPTTIGDDLMFYLIYIKSFVTTAFNITANLMKSTNTSTSKEARMYMQIINFVYVLFIRKIGNNMMYQILESVLSAYFDTWIFKFLWKRDRYTKLIKLVKKNVKIQEELFFKVFRFDTSMYKEQLNVNTDDIMYPELNLTVEHDVNGIMFDILTRDNILRENHLTSFVRVNMYKHVNFINKSLKSRVESTILKIKKGNVRKFVNERITGIINKYIPKKKKEWVPKWWPINRIGSDPQDTWDENVKIMVSQLDLPNKLRENILKYI